MSIETIVNLGGGHIEGIKGLDDGGAANRAKPASQGASFAETLGQAIESVDKVQLEADAPPSFTTMKLASPPRVVVDLAETSVSGVARQQEVGDGAVRRIAVADAGAHTARVVIELVADAEFDVRASQSRVEVRIPRPVAIARADPAPAPGSAPPDPAPAPASASPDPAPGPASAPPVQPEAEAATAELVPPPPAATTTDDASIPEARERAALPTVALVAGTAPAEPRTPEPARATVPVRATRPLMPSCNDCFQSSKPLISCTRSPAPATGRSVSSSWMRWITAR